MTTFPTVSSRELKRKKTTRFFVKCGSKWNLIRNCSKCMEKFVVRAKNSNSFKIIAIIFENCDSLPLQEHENAEKTNETLAFDSFRCPREIRVFVRESPARYTDSSVAHIYS